MHILLRCLMNISERNYKNGLRSITALLWCNDMYLIWILTQHARSWTDNSIAWWMPHEPDHEHILLSHIESVYPSSIPKAPKQIEVFLEMRKPWFSVMSRFRRRFLRRVYFDARHDWAQVKIYILMSILTFQNASYADFQARYGHFKFSGWTPRDRR